MVVANRTLLHTCECYVKQALYFRPKNEARVLTGLMETVPRFWQLSRMTIPNFASTPPTEVYN